MTTEEYNKKLIEMQELYKEGIMKLKEKTTPGQPALQILPLMVTVAMTHLTILELKIDAVMEKLNIYKDGI